MKSVTLIHPFTVGLEEIADFLQAWKTVDEYMKKQKGFIATKLHQSLEDAPGFRFINIAEWTSQEDFQKVIYTETFQNLAKKVLAFSHKPSVYTVIYE